MDIPTVHYRRPGKDVTLCGRHLWEVLCWYEVEKVKCKICRRGARKMASSTRGGK